MKATNTRIDYCEEKRYCSIARIVWSRRRGLLNHRKTSLRRLKQGAAQANRAVAKLTAIRVSVKKLRETEVNI